MFSIMDITFNNSCIKKVIRSGNTKRSEHDFKATPRRKVKRERVTIYSYTAKIFDYNELRRSID